MRIGISVIGYTSKPTNIGKISYKSRDIELVDLIDVIKNGYVLSANFSEDLEFEYHQWDRTQAKFISSPFVMIDLDDDYSCSLNELIEMLELKPTIAYTTFSHGIKGNRYRLLYIFNQQITSIGLCKALYNSLIKRNKLKLSDNCGCNPCQCVIGSKADCELIFNSTLYEIADILEHDEEKCISNIKREEERNIIEIEMHFHDKEFEEDYVSLCYESLLAKYLGRYPFFDHTPLKADEDTPFIVLPSNYIEIQRYWFHNKVVDEYENTLYYTTVVRKVRDGEHRKKKLFINGILRRFMLPSISLEHLLLNLVYELFYYIENTVDHITKETLLQIARRAYQADLTKYERLGVKTDKRKFIVNQAYCEAHGISKRTVRNYSRQVFTFNRICELYDTQLSDKENLEILKENGVSVCMRTLQKFKKHYGLLKNKKKKDKITSDIDMIEACECINT